MKEAGSLKILPNKDWKMKDLGKKEKGTVRKKNNTRSSLTKVSKSANF